MEQVRFIKVVTEESVSWIAEYRWGEDEWKVCVVPDGVLTYSTEDMESVSESLRGRGVEVKLIG